MSTAEGRTALSLLYAQVCRVLEEAMSSVKNAAAVSLQCVSTASHPPGDDDTNAPNDVELTTVQEALCGALARIYEALQDSSNTFFTSCDERTPVSDAGFQSDYLLDSAVLWNKLIPSDAIRTGKAESVSWAHRVSIIRGHFLSLVEAQTKLANASASAESLQRENGTLAVELRAAKSKVAELLSICESTRRDSPVGPLAESLKKENEVCYIPASM